MSRKGVPKEYEERVREYREAVAPFLGGEKVEAVGRFQRDDAFGWEGGWDDQFWIWRKFRKTEKGPLHDIPYDFLLAVTPDKVYVLSYRMKRSQHVVENKAAEFDRKSISFSSKELGIFGSVFAVLELTEEGRNDWIKIEALNSDANPWAAEVVAALSG